MLLTPFRYALGQIVYVREDLCAEYHVRPNEPVEIVSLTINKRGTFANCSRDHGARRLTIDERGLVLTNVLPAHGEKVPA